MLGNSVQELRKDQSMSGTLMFGKVVKVYHKNHSADVEIMNNQHGKLLTLDNNAGRYACKILENYAGFDSDLNMAYGSVTPIQVGCCVVVGFINNYKAQPVILGCLHSVDETKNMLPSEYPLNEGKEIDRKTTISKLGDYFTVNSDGEWEIAHHSGAFIHSSSQNDNINEEEFEWENLQLGGSIPYSPTAFPLNILAHLSTFVGKLRLFVHGMSGMVRLFRTGNNNLSLIEFDKDGNFRLKLQSDSDKIDKNTKKYTEIKVDVKTGDTKINQVVDSGHNTITLSKTSGVSIDSTMNINITNTKSMSLTSKTSIRVDAPHISISVDD